MHLFTRRCETLAVIAALCYGSHVIYASTITPPVASSTPFAVPAVTSTPIGTCESRTINYITHNLPQVCLRYARSDSAGLESPHTTATEVGGAETIPTSSGLVKPPADSGTSAEEPVTANLDADSALDESTFLSFEDWKRQTLEKEGLLDSSTGERRAQAPKDGERRRNPDGIQDALKALEEDVVIDTDFTAFLGDRSADSASKAPQGEDKPTKNTLQDVPEDKGSDENRRFRSKDAGKTCKERFNFASLDAGGQIMKTNPEAKSASALLKEDRDVYMLNTCQAKNKFLIVELSESILVETVAIANFEFFSSTFRQFRISASDRYPVKLDRWVDLGNFEARNSRDIQAFLVEDPRIWARYLRVEFLSHYGNEFYCPVSLLRVHGRTMIQDVLSMEELTRGEDEIEDDPEDLSERNGEVLVPEAIAEVLEEEYRVTEGLREAEAALEELVKTAEAITSSRRKDPLNSSQIIEVKRWLGNVSTEQTTTPWKRGESVLTTLFELPQSTDICLPLDAPASLATNVQERSNEISFANGSYQSYKSGVPLNDASALSAPPGPIGADVKEVNGGDQLTKISSLSQDFVTTTSPPKEPAASQTASAPGNFANATTISSSKSLNRTSPTSSSHSTQPTTQESFFKTVTKRLQLLEANSTLSLKYIEEQSRILRDAFTKVEKRQLAKTTSFLEILNDTVLEELRKFSLQYDQIWQSTVIELETQRDQSQREIAAVSTRLSMLAEELVFQKRMSIVQSVLLLLCLGLVIFSRSSAAGYLDVPIIQNMVTRSRNALDLPVESAPSSPPTHRMGSSLRGRPWLGPEHRRQRSDDSAGSLRSASRDYSPPTPFSTYSRQEEDSKQDNEQDDLLKGVRTSLMGAPSVKHEEPRNNGGSNPANWQESDVIPEEDSYPDFRNSALWLAPDSAIPDPSVVKRYEGTPSGGEEQSLTHNTHTSAIGRAMNGNVDEGRTCPITEIPYLPSPPPERDRTEFSIARKPLPALPKEDQ
jgi:hypothetical protein